MLNYAYLQQVDGKGDSERKRACDSDHRTNDKRNSTNIKSPIRVACNDEEGVAVHDVIQT